MSVTGFKDLCEAIHQNETSDENIKTQLLQLLQNWNEEKGFKLQKLNKENIRLLLELFLLKDKKTSRQVYQVLSDCLTLEEKGWCPSLDIFGIEDIDMIKDQLMPCLLETLEQTRHKDVLRYWVLVVRLLGRHLHSGADLINKVMKVVEKGFKIQETIEEAFRSWIVLMDNFALETRTLTNPKRIKLLLMPLVQRNVSSEAGVRVKFDAWWHFIVLLGPSNMGATMETVVMPFMRFCYGQSELRAKEQQEKSRQEGKSPGTPLSPAKNHSALEKLCLDALIQLLCPRPLHSIIPKPSLSETITETAITPALLCEHLDDILFSVREATRLVKPANRSDVVRVEQIWSAIAGSLSGVPSGHGKYLTAVRGVVVQHRRMERLCHLLVSIINDAAHLPVNILTSTSVLANNQEKPCSMLLDLLLYADFIEGSHKSLDSATHNLYCAVFTKLLEAHQHPSRSVQSHATVLDKLERCVNVGSLSQSGLEMVGVLWQILANHSAALDKLTNQSPGSVTTSFSSVIAVLMFPVQHLYTKGGDDRTLAAWEKLFKVVQEHGETSIHHESGHIVSEIADKLEAVLKTRQTSCQLLTNARIIKKMLENIDWATVARNLKNSSMPGSSKNPLAGFQRIINPLGNLTSLVNHLKHVTDKLIAKSREHLDISVSQQLLQCYQKLFSINQQDLIRPIIKSGTSTTFSKFLSESFITNILSIDASLLVDIEKVFTALVTLIKVKYNKEYTSEFLAEVEPFLMASLSSPRSQFKDQAKTMWLVTFQCLSQEDVPQQLRNILDNVPNSDGMETSLSSDSLTQNMVAEPAIMHGLRKTSSFEKTQSPASGKTKQVVTPAGKRTRKSLCLQLEEEDSALFVPIKSTPKGKRVLTDHQRDVLTSRHDDIPALYSELSRDDSLVMLPSQFSSQDSMSMDSDPKQSEDSNNSESLLKSLKSRKNQKRDIPERPRTLRSNISHEKDQNDTKDMFASSEGNSDDFKKPDNPTTEGIIEIESESVEEVPVNSSMSSIEEVIESSQEVTMDAGVTPRRSRRKSLIPEKDKNAAGSAQAVKEKESVDSKRNKWGETNLFVAVKKGDISKVRDLIEQGAGVEVSSSTGFYPLHEAAVSAKTEAVDIIKLLVENRANVDILSSNGTTPLHEALQFGSKDQVRALLQLGADIEMKTQDNKTSYELAEESGTEGMMDVLADERETYVEGEKRIRDERKVEPAVQEANETKVQDKSIEVDLDDNIVETTNTVSEEAMDCDVEQELAPEQNEGEETTDKEEEEVAKKEESQDVEEKSEDKVEQTTPSSPEGNKENVNSDESVGDDNSREPQPKLKEVPKAKSPFTTINPRQKTDNGGGAKKPLTPGSRGAMLLNLSRRVSLDIAQPPEPVVPRAQPSGSLTLNHVSVSVSPMRPWAKYAPSPSHASPSAGILKRTADDLDSSNDGSPVCAKRIRLDGPRRVHFNDNPVSESVEIPRTPKQQYTRKKLQMSALVDTAEDKETDEMEGVTSLVMYPDLVDNQDNISGVLYTLATGQWARILEQDLKQKQISTIGQLAAMDVKTVGQLRGVKPPKVQTVKLALASYHSKVKKEETSFRKGTPVQEETSQEEEDRIKAEFFSRPSPSPTDLASDQENVTEEEDKKREEDKVDSEASELPTTSAAQLSEEVEEEAEEEKAVESPSEESSEVTEKDVAVEESSSDEVVKETQDTIKVVPETESIEQEEEKVEEEEEPPKTQDPDIPSEQATVEDVPCKEIDLQEMETDVNEENDGSEDLERSAANGEIIEPAQDQGETPASVEVDVSDAVAVLSNTHLNLSKYSNEDLNQLFKNLCDHSRKVETLKENVTQVLFERLNQL